MADPSLWLPHLVRWSVWRPDLVAYDFNGNQVLGVMFLNFSDGTETRLPRLYHPAWGAWTLNTLDSPVGQPLPNANYLPLEWLLTQEQLALVFPDNPILAARYPQARIDGWRTLGRSPHDLGIPIGAGHQQPGWGAYDGATIDFARWMTPTMVDAPTPHEHVRMIGLPGMGPTRLLPVPGVAFGGGGHPAPMQSAPVQPANVPPGTRAPPSVSLRQSQAAASQTAPPQAIARSNNASGRRNGGDRMMVVRGRDPHDDEPLYTDGESEQNSREQEERRDAEAAPAFNAMDDLTRGF